MVLATGRHASDINETSTRVHLPIDLGKGILAYNGTWGALNPFLYHWNNCKVSLGDVRDGIYIDDSFMFSESNYVDPGDLLTGYSETTYSRTLNYTDVYNRPVTTYIRVFGRRLQLFDNNDDLVFDSGYNAQEHYIDAVDMAGWIVGRYELTAGATKYYAGTVFHSAPPGLMYVGNIVYTFEAAHWPVDILRWYYHFGKEVGEQTSYGYALCPAGILTSVKVTYTKAGNGKLYYRIGTGTNFTGGWTYISSGSFLSFDQTNNTVQFSMTLDYGEDGTPGSISDIQMWSVDRHASSHGLDASDPVVYASTTAPTGPSPGTIWWDTST